MRSDAQETIIQKARENGHITGMEIYHNSDMRDAIDALWRDGIIGVGFPVNGDAIPVWLLKEPEEIHA